MVVRRRTWVVCRGECWGGGVLLPNLDCFHWRELKEFWRNDWSTHLFSLQEKVFRGN